MSDSDQVPSSDQSSPVHDPGKPIALHFGAGSIGRGFIGAMLADSGYHVIFLDVNSAVVDALNHAHAYRVAVQGKVKEGGVGEDKDETVTIQDVEAVLAQDADTIVRDLAQPRTRIVTTAVGAGALPKLAPTLARGIHARHAEARGGAAPLNVVACENMVRQTAALKEHVYEHLSEPARAWADEYIGFADCSVDRIVPGGDGNGHEDAEHSLDVGVEAFAEWIVDATALRAPIEPHIRGMMLTDKLDAYVERKLYTLNCAHATAAYVGFLRGHATIDRALEDPDVERVVRGALREGGAALVRRHGFDAKDHARYTDTVFARIANPRLADRIERVGRQPLRKLGRRERLLGPTYIARELGLPINDLARAIAAAFLFDINDDEESVRLMALVRDAGIEGAIAEVAGFEHGSEEHGLIVTAYRELRSWREN